VPGFGDPNARVLIVGLAPAAHGANRTGRVFTGDGAGGSGDFLMSALHRAGFANLTTSHHPGDGLMLRDAFILAAVRCAPPANKPTPGEITNCLPHFDAELDALPTVRVVVALAKIGFDAYLNLLKHRGLVIRPKPIFGHGVAHVLPNGHTLVGLLSSEPPEHEYRQAHADNDRRGIQEGSGSARPRRSLVTSRIVACK